MWKSEFPLGPLAVEIEGVGVRFSMTGNRLIMVGLFQSLDQLIERIASIYYRLPLLLNIDFVDSPIVVRVSGKVGGSTFEWVLQSLKAELDITNLQRQEEKVTKAWDRFSLLENRRIQSALHYFRQACRLERTGFTPFEFTAEILLNLSKSLEVLFPGRNGREAARDGLANLGYSEAEIEERFLPAMALRSYIDVAHVSLAPFSPDNLAVLHRYTEETAEPSFRDLMRRVCNAVAAGKLELAEVKDKGPGPAARKIIDRLRQRQSDHAGDEG